MSCCPVNTVQEGASHDVPQSLQKSLYSDILMFHHPAYAINLPVFSSYSPYFHTTSLAVDCYILYQLSFISHFHIPEYMFQMAYGKQGNRRSWCCPCWPSADLSERPNSGKFQTHGLLSGGVNNESTRFAYLLCPGEVNIFPARGRRRRWRCWKWWWWRRGADRGG